MPGKEPKKFLLATMRCLCITSLDLNVLKFLLIVNSNSWQLDTVLAIILQTYADKLMKLMNENQQS